LLGGPGFAALHFSVARIMRFTCERDTPNVRAIFAGFSPAPNDARIRFAFPSGISAILAASARDAIGAVAVGAGPSPLLLVELPRFRLPSSASTAACRR